MVTAGRAGLPTWRRDKWLEPTRRQAGGPQWDYAARRPVPPPCTEVARTSVRRGGNSEVVPQANRPRLCRSTKAAMMTLRSGKRKRIAMTNLQAGILHAFGMVLITLNQLALADYSNGTSEQSKNPALIPALAQSTYSNPGKTVSSLFDGLINMTDSNQSSGDTNLKSLSSPLIASGSRGSQSEASSYSDISQAQKHESNSVSATQSPQILPPKAHAIGQMKPALLDATRTLDRKSVV